VGVKVYKAELIDQSLEMIIFPFQSSNPSSFFLKVAYHIEIAA
jgi:hypothetical protein